MSNISVPFTFTPNTLAASTQVNGNFAAIVADYNGNVTNFNIAATANIASSKINGLSSINGFRLSSSNSTALPVDAASVSTIYLYPYTGSQIALNDGSGNFNVFDLGSTIPSLALSGLTSSNMYSVYASNTGTVASPTVALSVIIWTGATTPDSQTVIDGVIHSSSNNKLRYVGCFWATGATTTSDTGLGGQRYLASYCNPVLRSITCTDSAGGPSASTTFVAVGTTNGTSRVSFVQATSGLTLTFGAAFVLVNNTAAGISVAGVAVDSTSAANYEAVYQAFAANGQGSVTISANLGVGAGFHFLQRGFRATSNSASVGANSNYASCALLSALVLI